MHHTTYPANHQRDRVEGNREPVACFIHTQQERYFYFMVHSVGIRLWDIMVEGRFKRFPGVP